MIWLWRNSPGKLHLKIQSHLGDKEGTYHQIWAACWGKLYLKSPLWAWLTMPEDTKLRWTVLIALFPDFTWKWDADALPVPLIRLDLDHHHSSLTWLWAPVSLPACAHHTHPWKVLVSGWEGQGNFQEISQMHRTWGSISFSARRSTFFLFLLFTGFQSLMKDLCEQVIQCKVDDALQCFLKSNTFMSWYSRKLPIIILIPLGLNSRRIN